MSIAQERKFRRLSRSDGVHQDSKVLRCDTLSTARRSGSPIRCEETVSEMLVRAVQLTRDLLVN